MTTEFVNKKILASINGEIKILESYYLLVDIEKRAIATQWLIDNGCKFSILDPDCGIIHNQGYITSGKFQFDFNYIPDEVFLKFKNKFGLNEELIGNRC